MPLMPLARLAAIVVSVEFWSVSAVVLPSVPPPSETVSVQWSLFLTVPLSVVSLVSAVTTVGDASTVSAAANDASRSE